MHTFQSVISSITYKVTLWSITYYSMYHSLPSSQAHSEIVKVTYIGSPPSIGASKHRRLSRDAAGHLAQSFA